MIDDPTDPTDPTEAIDRMAGEMAAKLAELCDSVVIVCTHPKPANDDLGPRTGLVTASRGNYYAQQGSVTQWLKGNPEFEPVADPRPPDDGDEWKGAEA